MGPSVEAGTVSDQVRLQGEHVACLSLFTEPSEPLPEEPKLEGMAFHHCHKDPMPQSGLSPERVQARRQLYAACAVCFLFMAGEVVGKLGDTPPVPHSVLPQPPSTKSPWFPGWRSKEVKGREGLEGQGTEGGSSE